MAYTQDLGVANARQCFFGELLEEIIMVGGMGCVPACGLNSISRNASCSQPSLNRQGMIDRLKTFTSHSDT